MASREIMLDLSVNNFILNYNIWKRFSTNGTIFTHDFYGDKLFYPVFLGKGVSLLARLGVRCGRVDQERLWSYDKYSWQCGNEHTE